MSEFELLSRARQFDKVALGEIYDQFSGGIYRYAVRQLGDPSLAEECVSETFSRLLNALQRGRGPKEYLKAYLYRTAHNWITDNYRRQPPPTVPLEPDLITNSQDDPETSVESKFEQERIRMALAQITPDQRQVIALKYLEEWTTKEIAITLNKSITAVKALQQRGLAALKRILEDD